MAQEVASLYAKIGADLSGFKRGMNQFNTSINNAGGAFRNFTTGIVQGVGMAFGQASISAVRNFAGAMTSSVGAAADMEQQVANISAVMGLAGDETNRVSKLINDLGIDPKLKVTAVEAAQAVEMLGRNGLSLQQILDGAARSTVLLANSTGADFATAADIATDVMAQFKIAADDMSRAVNGIAGVTKSSKFDINDYRLAIAQAGGVAASVGVSFEDFNATIAAISPSFASGSDAGTSFKVFLQRLIPQSKEAAGLMQELGIITADGANRFFDAAGNMRSMSEIAGVLQSAFSGLSEEQKINAASTIFGTDAMRAAFGLADAGTATIDRLKKAIGDTSAENAAATRMDTLRGAWSIFQGIVESLSIQFGTGFLPAARQVVEVLTELASEIGPSVVQWGQQFGERIAGLATMIRPAIKSVRDFYNSLAGQGIRKTLGLLQDVFVKLGVNIAKLVRPFRDALGGLFQQLAVMKNLGFADIFRAVLSSIGKAFSGFITEIKENFWPTVQAAVQFVWDGLVAYVTNIDWSSVWTNVKDAFSGLWTFITGIDWAGVWGAIGTAFSTLATTVSNIDWSSVWSTITSGAQAIGTFIAETVFPALGTFFSNLLSWFTDPTKRQQLWNGIVAVWDFVSEWAGKIWDWASPYLSSFWSFLTSWFTDANKRSQIWNGIVAIWDFVSEWAGKIWEWASPYLASFWLSLSSWVTDPKRRQEIWDATVKTWNFITEWAGKIWDWASPYLTDAFTYLTSWITDPGKRDQLKTKIAETWTGFTVWAGNVWNTVSPLLSSMYTSMKTWIDENYPTFGTWIDKVTDFVTSALKQFETEFPKMKDAVTGLRTRVETEAPLVLQAMGRLWKSLFGGDSSANGTTFAQQVSWFFNTITSAISNMITQVRILIEVLAIMIETTKAAFRLDWAAYVQGSMEFGTKLGEFMNTVNQQWQQFSQFPGFAKGGIMRETGIALVGERGPELVTLPGGAKVSNHAQTMAMLNQSSAPVSSRVDVYIHNASNVPIDRRAVKEIAIALQKELNLYGNKVVFAT